MQVRQELSSHVIRSFHLHLFCVQVEIVKTHNILRVGQDSYQVRRYCPVLMLLFEVRKVSSRVGINI